MFLSLQTIEVLQCTAILLVWLVQSVLHDLESEQAYTLVLACTELYAIFANRLFAAAAESMFALLASLSTFTQLQQGCFVQVGRTGMDTGADAEILSLLDLPFVAPSLWTMLSQPQGAQIKSDKVNNSAQDITANTHIAVLR